MTLYLCFAYDSIYEYNRALDTAIKQKQTTSTDEK